MYPKFSKRKDGDTVVMEQRLLKKVSHLLLDTTKCIGCGICAEACPKTAIKLGMVGAVVRGAVTDGAPISVDPSLCSYCGVCTILCPFNALDVEVDGEHCLPIKDGEGFPEYDYTAEINEEKCVRCTTCSEVCEHGAIVREVPAYEGEVDGGALRQTALDAKVSFNVDMDKCTVCGICGSLCPAITVARDPFNAGAAKPTGEVVWDEKLCNSCRVCEDACPHDAIAVKREVTAGAKLAGKVVIDKDECVTCSWCKAVCPSEAVTIKKFFEGEITFNQAKCPGGCSTCVDVCPCNAIYLPSPLPARLMKRDSIEDKIAVNHDLCILCGACVNACPSEDAITLKRTAVHVTGKETDLYKKIEAKLCTERTSKVVENTFGEVELKRR